MTRSPIVFLSDTLESINAIEEDTAGLDEAAFLKSRTIQDAVIRRLEIIGEAVKNVPEEVRAQAPDVRWSSVAGLRDV